MKTSPYIINYLSLAIKGGDVLEKIKTISPQNVDELLGKLSSIVPERSCINGEDVAIYEFDRDGSIKKLSTYKGIPSDKNYLN